MNKNQAYLEVEKEKEFLNNCKFLLKHIKK